MKQPSETSAKKKPYQSPKLFIYGSLHEMTQMPARKGIRARPDGKTTGVARRTG